MEQSNLGLAIVGTLVLVLGLLSDWIRGSLLSEPLLALVAGVVCGPLGFDLLHFVDDEQRREILEQAARLTLAIGLMGITLRALPGDIRRRWRTLLVLIGVLMPVMWLISGLLVYLVIGLPLLTALLIGAIVTPTDPIVATSIVSGKFARESLLARLRHTLSGESGANDGLACLIVFLPILLLTKPAEHAWSEWLLRVILWEVGFAIVAGVVLGYGAGRLLRRAEAQDSIEQTSFLGYTTALSIVVLATVKLAHANGILAVFVAGIVFAQTVSQHERNEEENVQETVNQFFLLPIFFLLGLAIPWNSWLDLGWAGVILVVTILLLRRLPAFLALSRCLPAMRHRPTRSTWDGLGQSAYRPCSTSISPSVKPISTRCGRS